MTIIAAILESQLLQGFIAALVGVFAILGYGYKQRKKGEREIEEDMERRNQREILRQMEIRDAVEQEIEQDAREQQQDNPDSDTPYADRLRDSRWNRD